MKTPARNNWLNAQLLGCLLAVCCASAHAQDAVKPLLLVASPALQGPYQQTTLVAVPVEGKHIGFILNRATDVRLATLFPEHASSAVAADPVYIGGPEMNDSLFAIVRRDPGSQSLQLFGELFVTGNADAINRIIEKTPNDARYFAGFVGWLSGELENEIARGLWYVAEPDAGLVFRQDTSGMWDELVKRLGDALPLQRAPGLIETRTVIPSRASALFRTAAQ
jgi:putative transcriptional regulator